MDAAGRTRDGALRKFAAGTGLCIVVVAVLAWWLAGHWGDAGRLAQSPDRDDRIRAIDMLRGRGDEASRRMLLRLCGDGDVRVAMTAVWALGEARDGQGARLLRQILQDRSRRAKVRGEAAAALGKAKGVDPAVLADILTRDGEPDVRAGAARGLHHLRSPKAAAALLAALTDADKRVRREAIGALQNMMLRRFPYDPELPASRQRQVLADIEAYLRAAGALDGVRP